MTNTYRVTRKFTDGTLKGLTHTGIGSIQFPVGTEVKRPIGGSPYVVVECEPVGGREMTENKIVNVPTVLEQKLFGTEITEIKVGDKVVVRWTNSFKQYEGVGEVEKVNRKTVRVRLTQEVPSQISQTPYPVGQLIIVPVDGTDGNCVKATFSNPFKCLFCGEVYEYGDPLHTHN